jgi:hypothetical protein
MERSEEHELEQFIQAQLQKLPEREAPEDLVSNVMAAIAARQNLPWWKQPFTSWPRGSQGLLLVSLSALLGGLIYAAWRPAESVSLSALTEQVAAWSWIGRTIESITSSAAIILRSLPWQAFAVIGLLVTMMYALCVVTGLALYRVASPQPIRAA